jgi:hypothetical protein
MEYKVIFACGYVDDLESLTKDLRGDILLLDQEGNYYNPQYITIERIKAEFGDNKVCYLEDNLVLLHEVTKDNILKSVPELYKWHFYKRWLPLSKEQLEKYFYPKEDWVVFIVNE